MLILADKKKILVCTILFICFCTGNNNLNCLFLCVLPHISLRNSLFIIKAKGDCNTAALLVSLLVTGFSVVCQQPGLYILDRYRVFPLPANSQAHKSCFYIGFQVPVAPMR